MKTRDNSKIISMIGVFLLTCLTVFLRCTQLTMWNHEKVYVIGIILLTFLVFLAEIRKVLPDSYKHVMAFIIVTIASIVFGTFFTFQGVHEYVPIFIPTGAMAVIYGAETGVNFHLFYITYLYTVLSYYQEKLPSELFVRWMVIGVILAFGIRCFKDYFSIAVSGMTVLFSTAAVNLFYFNFLYDKIKYDKILQNVFAIFLTLSVGILILIFQKLYRKEPELSGWVEVICDENFPPVREYKDKAPDSYIHAMEVDRLAGLAAKKINANSGVVKAGALYHEIGKSVSRDYIKAGIEICVQYDIPECIVDIIVEHGLKIRNPRTLESAIVMLADSVMNSISYMESRKQAFDKKKIVDQVMKVRMESGSLNNSGITIGQFQDIWKVFAAEYSEENKVEKSGI